MTDFAPGAAVLVFAGTHARAENVRFHAHPCRELILVIDGECDVDADSRTLHAQPGDLLRLPARLMHNQVSNGFISTVYLGFEAPRWDAAEPDVVHLGDAALVRECMLLLARIHMHQTAASPAAAASLLQAVLDEVEHQTQARPRDRVPAQLQPILRFLDARLADPLEVEDIAAAGHMSSSNLHKLFRHHLDTSPHRYLLDLRMERARKHLRDPYLTVKEIARLCGYPDVNLFVRTFRRVHGAPPQRWRREKADTAAGPGAASDPTPALARRGA